MDVIVTRGVENDKGFRDGQLRNTVRNKFDIKSVVCLD